MVKRYIPEKGDIVLLNFTPQKGGEQAGRRPAIALSPKEYNSKTGLSIFCPITTKIKNYPFEVLLPNSLKTKGAILSDHIKNIDFNAREAKFIEKAPKKTLSKTLSLLKILLEE